MENGDFFPYEEIVVREVLERVVETEPRALSASLLAISLEFGKMSLPKIQEILVELDSNLYLIAKPANIDPRIEARWPNDKREYNYFLEVFIGSRDRFEKFLKKHTGTTYNENFWRLSETGLPRIKEGTEFSLSMRAPYN